MVFLRTQLSAIAHWCVALVPVLCCVALTSCFDPRTAEGLACTGSGGCPSGQDCVAGLCYRPGNGPDTDASVDAATVRCTTEVMATGQLGATDLDAADATYVYWTDDSGTLVLRSPKVRGPVEVFHDSGLDKHPHGIVTDATHVYWTESDGAGRILSKAKDSIEADLPLELALGQGEPVSIAVDETYVYWANLGGNSINRILKLGGAIEVIAVSQLMPTAIALDETHIYWVSTGSGTVMRSAKDGAPLQQLAGGQGQLSSLALTSDSVFWTDGTSGEVLSVGKGGGSPSVVASGQSGPASIAVAPNVVYWGNELGGQVLVLPADSTSITEVAVGQSQPVGLEVDGADVYWLNKLDVDNRLVRASCDPL
tara:strand:- start:257854 stop:258957 length:1104 start_codon:yes stop_codon:yes gene_type:complete